MRGRALLKKWQLVFLPSFATFPSALPRFWSHPPSFSIFGTFFVSLFVVSRMIPHKKQWGTVLCLINRRSDVVTVMCQGNVVAVFFCHYFHFYLHSYPTSTFMFLFTNECYRWQLEKTHMPCKNKNGKSNFVFPYTLWYGDPIIQYWKESNFLRYCVYIMTNVIYINHLECSNILTIVIAW